MSSSTQPRFRGELGATLRLAAPLAIAQVAQIAMGATDTILLGSLGGDALAAGGLGANLFFMLMVTLQNGLSVVASLISHARGAGESDRIAPILRGGAVLALALMPVSMLGIWHVEAFMRLIGEPSELAHAVGRYDRVLALAVPAMLLLGVQRA